MVGQEGERGQTPAARGTSCCLSLLVTQKHWHAVKEGLWLLPLECSLSVPHFPSFVQGQCLYSVIHYANWDAQCVLSEQQAYTAFAGQQELGHSGKMLEEGE